ncbi:glycoside hydrolase family 3 N-terminal domain-containing protein [Microbacterium sp. NPDC090003]|uniref:glycoside hydrolase family 3 N-terminal domain-containing protein n=1 Tax=Microbacterium sp. NPDC090003 TaxID=3364203 RepID=UPI0037F74364
MRTLRRRMLATVAALAVAAVAAPAAAQTPSEKPRTTALRVQTDAAIPSVSGPGARAEAEVRGMSVAEQAASVVMGHVPVTDAAALRAYMQQGLGGFILMGSNIPATESELQALTSALTVDESLPPLIAIDQEGGIVSRLPSDTFAASTSLKSAPVAETTDAFTARASLVARAGVNVNFGTVADVTSDSASFIYGRALGTDPSSASERVAAATTAQEELLASTLKHFPGHGAAAGDSHHAIPTTPMSKEEWRTADAPPFDAGIDAGASLLMFGHLAYTAVDPAPASMSAEWHRIAREELGFEGVMVTDDLGMLLSSGDPAFADPVANGVAAIAAGNDLVLMIAGSSPETAGQMVAGLVAAVESGDLPAERLADAATRVRELRLELAADTADWSVCESCTPAR